MSTNTLTIPNAKSINYLYRYLSNLSLDSVLSLRESDLLLSLLLSGSRGLEFGQSSSQSSGLLGSQVLWLVFLTLVQLSDSFSLLQVDDSQNTSNVLSDSLDLW